MERSAASISKRGNVRWAQIDLKMISQLYCDWGTIGFLLLSKEFVVIVAKMPDLSR